MECKIFVPLEVCRTANHVVDRTQKKGAKCSHNGMKYAVWCLSFVVLLLVVSIVHLYLQVYQLHSVLADCGSRDKGVLARTVVTGKSGSKHREVTSHQNQDTGQNVKVDDVDEAVSNRFEVISQVARFKRSRDRRSGQYRRKLRSLQNQIDSLRAAILKPVVHLRGNRSVTTDLTRTSIHNVPACRNYGCFRWSRPDRIYQTNFQYVEDTSYTKVIGVNITSPGVYFVYSQVGVNGPQQSFDPSVGYETVKTDSTGTEYVLLRTFATQDNKGRNYHGDDNYPHDSLNHFGLFKFNCHDTIVVRQASTYSNHPPNFVFDKYQSFFGIVQINPTNGALTGDYDCNSP